jgi:hypothetical protein
MAELEVFFHDDEIVETRDSIERPIAVAQCDDVPTLHEACTIATTIVFLGDYKAASVALDGLFFMGITMRGDSIKFIHTPAADAFFDEFYPGWRHGLNAPMFLN